LAAAVLFAGCGSGGSATPASAAVVAPSITTQPASQNIGAGAPVTFSVASSGSAPISYQWKRDGNVIAGATSASYTFPAAQRSDTASQWTVAVSNSAGTVNSNAAILTVGPGMVLMAGAPGGAGTALGVGGRLDRPTGIALDAAGNLFVATASSIRRVAPDGNISVAAISRATCCGPNARGIAVGTDGTLYEGGGFGIRKTTPAGVSYTVAEGYVDVESLVVDAQGTLYVAGTSTGTISKVMSDGSWSILAGTPYALEMADGTGAAARFAAPRGIARDSAGNLYVADTNTIRKITPAGVVTTIAGVASQSGTADGAAGVGRLDRPTSLAVDKAGNVLIADSGNFTIRKLTPAGVLSTITGVVGLGDDSGNPKVVDTAYNAQGLGYMVIDSADNLFFADTNNHVIRKRTPDGVLSTVAGIRARPGNVDGAGAAARFDQSDTTARDIPSRMYAKASISADAAGNIYITANMTIRKVASDGTTSSLTKQADPADMYALYSPVAIGLDGSVYGYSDGVVFKTNANGTRTNVAGHLSADAVDGAGTEAAFSVLGRIAIDAAGNIYLLDRDYMEPKGFRGQYGFHLNGWESVRKITPEGVVSTIAGYTGKVGRGPVLVDLKDILVDPQGNVFVIARRQVIKIAPDGTQTAMAGTEIVDSSPVVHGVDLLDPAALALDRNGNVYVADNGAFKVHKIAPDGGITTVAGRANESGAVAGASPASIGTVTGMTVDAKGTLYLMMENALFKIEQ
jgi:sugar lactone lactonase YvrE